MQRQVHRERAQGLPEGRAQAALIGTFRLSKHDDI